MPCEEEAGDVNVEGAGNVDCGVVFEFVCCARVETGIKLRWLGHDTVDGVGVRYSLIPRHIVPVLSNFHLVCCATIPSE